MHKVYILLNIFIFVIFPGQSKNLDSIKATNHKEFYIDWDNDMWLQKDYYYSQGASINLVHPVFKKNPINHLLFHLNSGDNYFGLGVHQEIFTPKGVKDSIILPTDRPYAGTFFIRSSLVSNNPAKKIRLTTQLDLGILGPLSGAEMAQRYIHEWLGLDVPAGWKFQIDNRPYINYNVQFDHQLFSVKGHFDVMSMAHLRVGNIHDDVQLGISARFGWVNNFFKGYRLSDKTYAENNNFQCYIYGSAYVRAVAYNATLMGGIIPPESSHQFALKQTEWLVGNIVSGLHISYKNIGAYLQTTFISPEFKNGKPHGWGSVSISYRF